MESKAIFKFNSGMFALLCSGCRKIIKEGRDFTDEEWQACEGKIKMEPQFCEDCEKAKTSKS